MTKTKPIRIDYALADISALARPSLEDIEPRELRFLQYSNSFVALSGESMAKDSVTLADVNAFIIASGRPLQHRIMVWVAAKYLKGAEYEHTARARVFSSYEAAQRYLGLAGDDDLSLDDDDIYTSLHTCVIDAVGELDPCSCVEQMNQEDALKALSPAKPGPEQGGTMDARGKQIEASFETLTIWLMDGRRLEVPRSWFAYLPHTDNAYWHQASLDGSKRFIKWPGCRKRAAIEALLVAP